MKQGDRCPCCFDTDHQNSPIHDLVMTQVVEERGDGTPYVARYYYCPVVNEMYEDEELFESNVLAMENAGRMNERKNDG